MPLFTRIADLSAVRALLGAGELMLAVGAAVVLTVPTACGSTRSGGAPEAPRVSGPVLVVASIFPLGDAVRQAGGDAVRVEVLLPPGASPHGYEPKPAQAELLAGAEILLTVGLGVDLWADRLAEASGNRHLRRLEVTGSTPKGMPGGPSRDPHIWLDPFVMKGFVADVAVALVTLRPDSAAGISARTEAYRAELDSLDDEYRIRLAAAPSKAFVTLHAAFHYMAARYGLNEVSVFDSEMDEPGPGDLERVARFVRAQRIRVILVQPELPLSSVAWLREQMGLQVATLDDLGNPLLPGYDSYLTMMRSNLNALAGALGE
jgi:zinc transport system substrate-binding protein